MECIIEGIWSKDIRMQGLLPEFPPTRGYKTTQLNTYRSKALCLPDLWKKLSKEISFGKTHVVTFAEYFVMQWCDMGDFLSATASLTVNALT